jgi:hypothetical protein
LTATDQTPAAAERAADRCKCSHSRRNHTGTRIGPCVFSGCGCGKFRPKSETPASEGEAATEATAPGIGGTWRRVTGQGN